VVVSNQLIKKKKLSSMNIEVVHFYMPPPNKFITSAPNNQCVSKNKICIINRVIPNVIHHSSVDCEKNVKSTQIIKKKDDLVGRNKIKRP
jgi:hypothetical protein